MRNKSVSFAIVTVILTAAIFTALTQLFVFVAVWLDGTLGHWTGVVLFGVWTAIITVLYKQKRSR